VLFLCAIKDYKSKIHGKIFFMMIIIGTNSNETIQGPLVVITMTIMDVIHLRIMKTFHNYLIPSLLSPIQLHGYERPFHNWIFIIWLDSTQHTYENKFNSNWFEFNQFVLNWVWFSSTIFNSIEISMKTWTMLNPKEKNIVFNSI
jgi:hypothetical protein